MNFISITLLVVFAISVVVAHEYKEVQLEPNGKPFPGLKRGSRSEVIPSAGSNIEGRIVHGQYASAEQFPYHVGVMSGYGSNSYSWCGGTLIGNEWIITAAHCTSGAQTIEVRLGSINSETPLRISWGYQNHIHRDYATQHGDIALVKIQWVDFNVNMAPAALPPLNGQHSLYVNDNVVATGWGATDNNGGKGNHLKYIVTKVIEPQECANVYGSFAGDPQIICTRTQGGTCSGDSGGPLVLENTRLLVGVTTFVAAGACGAGFPDGFSRVTYYLGWIKDISGISW
ncbi:serine protease 3-like [Episyrphus balteatus]|uniref:serine protease 3-like n=1 Tax=Episyrphus balteatus TaxID=286459 RepID=UPI0024855F86|nr:serine protease 3-like [Episyrphus balteatus]